MDEDAEYEMTRGTVVFEMDTDPPRSARITCEALTRITGRDVRARAAALDAYRTHWELIHRAATDHPDFADGEVTLRASDF